MGKRTKMEVRTRETWRNEDEVSFEVEAFENETKMFVPGATVTRDRHYGESVPRVSVRWASSDSTGDLSSARAQLAVMTEAIRLADTLA
jgi:hypothetical protein